jgi:hypothetical protein
MTKMKFALAAIAALIGIGGAYASKEKTKPATVHHWRDINAVTQFIGTTAQAEEGCPGNVVFCLKAADASAIIVKQL